MMKRVKRSKKRDERIVNDPFKKLPNDLNVEILMKMPPRSIARLRFASKHLSSIILDKEFTKLYMTRSSTQPRHLISVHRGGSSMQMQRFHSLSQDHPSFSNHEKVSYKLDPNLPYEFTPPVRGLICGRQRRGSKVVSEEHQVYTLGAQRKWRMIESSLISFDLISEEFNAIKLPEDIPCVVNYTGKVAITSWPTRNGEVHLWILEDANKQEWSKVSIVVPSWIDLIDIHHGYRFRGTLSTGELIFSPWTLPINPLYFISYNLKENIAKKVVVEELEEPYASREVYFDHVESPMFCQM
ncbi:BnaC01g39960D [Brassica napus]|uniref:BnaC01g39960D protein n=1 Tax=Brassica napus TaxID=3708 RepID=A0A078GXT4_BRANA|nr:BnaC01g39960D [Brassica napus]